METESATRYPPPQPLGRFSWPGPTESLMDVDNRDSSTEPFPLPKASLHSWPAFEVDTTLSLAPASDVTSNKRTGQLTSKGKEKELQTRDASPPAGEPAAVISLQDSRSLATNPAASPVAEPSTDPFAHSLRIPGSSPAVFVYPNSTATISASFHSRFHEVVDIFRQNTEVHSQLREHVQHIDYVLRLCGSAPDTAYPSILVFCRQSEFSPLKSLLTHKHLRFQYSLRRSSSTFSWMRRRRNQLQDAAETHRPLFNLYFWRQKTPRILLWGIQRPISKNQDFFSTHLPSISSLTLCGHVVRWMGSTSTLGCVIRIGTEFYGVTTAHAALRHLGSHSECSRGAAPQRSIDASLHVEPAQDDVLDWRTSEEGTGLLGLDEDFDDYLMDEVEYNDLSDDDGDDEEVEDEIGLQRPTLGSDLSPEEIRCLLPRKAEEMSAIFTTQDELHSAGERDLDWALIKLNHPTDWRPNAFIDPDDDNRAIFPSVICRILPNEAAMVFILSNTRTLQGTLQPIVSVLGGINGRTRAEVWTVTLPLSSRQGRHSLRSRRETLC